MASITKRSIKGSPLTHDEMDENFEIVLINSGSVVLLNEETGSINTSVDALNALTQSIVYLTGSQTITGQKYFAGTQTFENLNVNGTGSFGFLQQVTGSITILGNPFAVLNTNTPASRFGGLQVIDSGSSTTGSVEYDAVTDKWIHVFSDGNSSAILSGPSGSDKTNISLPTVNTVLKSNGSTNLVDSSITDDGNTVSIDSNFLVSGSSILSGSSSMIGGLDIDGDVAITGSLTVTNSIVDTIFSGSFSGSYEGDGSNITGVVTSETASYVDFSNIDNKPTLVSSSIQIDVEQTTNYDEVVNISGSQNIYGVKTFKGNNTFEGLQSFNNIDVSGTASFGLIQSITGSAKIVGDAFIILNSNTPAEPYAGIIVYDSGSTPIPTASFFFDSENNDWNYEYSGSDGTDLAVAIFGPEYSTKGTPSYLSNNTLPKGDGGHHLNDSSITDDGTEVYINNSLRVESGITGSVSGSLVGTLLGTSSFANFSLSSSFSSTAGEVDFNSIRNKPSLLSGSNQIATDISGAFGEVSSSLSDRITAQEAFSSSLDATFATDAELSSVSSSAASDISDIIDGTTTVTSSSYAVTASFALNAGGGSGAGFPFEGKAEITGSLEVSGSVIIDGSLTELSSLRYKSNVNNIENALDKVTSLRGVTFTKDSKTEIGLIAEEVVKYFPEIVTLDQSNQPDGVEYSRIGSILIEAIKELSNRVEELEEKVKSLS